MMKENFLGVDVAPLTYKEIIKQITKNIEAGEPSTVIAVNPEKVMKAREDEQLRDLINGSTFQIPDGIGVVLASKWTGGAITERVTGIEMMGYLLHLAEQRRLRVFIYGAKEEVVTEAIANIKKNHPNITIAGYENGYEDDEEKVVQHIQEAEADMLFVALGSPKQELWIRRNKERLPVKVYQGVGGSLDVWAGAVQWAPKVWRDMNLEWLYRLLSDPKRFKRQTALPKFAWEILTKGRKRL
ncbi:WecB/TagA/CpsF family glycosyltransferase [Salimicrobium halophilum]|uniref:N-acetylglucosaminyldiphosphoundecaprenol N-acetyl-beta-D-mannosaminyltransferase n=1 Tax=Salimicrobium halophilum TaxID=86666 RepID=A0A1G8SEW1_9BACI|nr:WecB/TagA/CpsF family glycosyltransferase [Salimicrobium halophilum]SDJ27714.1 N-acetylglucosaminyldiphosphoundecaprenol N-acetyl-beta-D-mannosaminyltransferase [Salimicrobium halophilum]